MNKILPLSILPTFPKQGLLGIFGALLSGVLRISFSPCGLTLAKFHMKAVLQQIPCDLGLRFLYCPPSLTALTLLSSHPPFLQCLLTVHSVPGTMLHAEGYSSGKDGILPYLLGACFDC